MREVPSTIDVAVLDQYPGEGDFDNVYLHIHFELRAREDAPADGGWIRSDLRKGDRSRGTLVVLYQKERGGDWQPTRHWLEPIASDPD